MDPFERHFAPRPQTVPRARQALSQWLDEAHVGSDSRWEVLLVASELMSNGVIHDGDDDLVLRAWEEDRSIRVEVVSRAPRRLLPDPRGYDACNFGRGLTIVNELAEHSVTSNGSRRVDRCRIPLGRVAS